MIPCFFKKKADYVQVDGSILAPPNERWCGKNLKNNQFYLSSAEAEAKRLINDFDCNQDSHVLDIGCGQGRLAIGLLRTIGSLHYTGLDVHKPSIQWCKKYIEKKNPSFQFKHLNIYNERYSEVGATIDESFSFDIEISSIDIIYLYSVFSHMKKEEMEVYLKDFKRILSENGKVVFSAYFEDGVEDYTINPSDFHFEMNGPLHAVRYSKKHLFSIVERLGFSALEVKDTSSSDHNGQKIIYLSHR
jgi:cyclopropane fatty-acyl-phospholipid synthase-like methyltransferase